MAGVHLSTFVFKLVPGVIPGTSKIGYQSRNTSIVKALSKQQCKVFTAVTKNCQKSLEKYFVLRHIFT